MKRYDGTGDVKQCEVQEPTLMKRVVDEGSMGEKKRSDGTDVFGGDDINADISNKTRKE